MKPIVFRLAAIFGALLVGSLLFFALDVPQEISSLKEKQQQIRERQRKIADLTLEIQKKKDRIQKLRDNRTEQELEIRDRNRMLRRGETSFILQEQEKK